MWVDWCDWQVRHASVSNVKPPRSTEHSSSVSAADDDDNNDDYIIVDKQASAARDAGNSVDKNVDKLLKFVADNDVQMVGLSFGFLPFDFFSVILLHNF